MTPLSEIKTLLKQDLIQKNEEALANTSLKLKSILYSNLKTLNSPLSDQAIHERLSNIFSILDKSIKDLPKFNFNHIDKLIERLNTLVELHDSLQPNMISKCFNTGAREEIKKMLNTKAINFRETIDPHIHFYLAAQRDILAYYIALNNAHWQSERIQTMQHKYPGSQIEIIKLKRHEVCSNFHKGFGFNPDTGLDALHFTGTQSLFELTTSQSVQNQQLQIMKITGHIHKVEMIVSPVTRAYETAIHATFSSSIVDSVTVDNHFSEEQMNTILVASGRAYRVATDVVNEFSKHGYKNVKAKEDFIIEGETKISFYQRRNEAYRRMLFSPLEKQNIVIMKTIIGHGGMHNGLIAHLKHTIKNNNIPHAPRRLNFGGQYNMIIARDDAQNIIALDDGGNINRYGMIEQTTQRQLPESNVNDYVVYLKKAIQEEQSAETKAMLLFSYCMVEEDLINLSNVINDDETRNLMLDKLPLFECEQGENLERMDFILNLLINAQFSFVEKRLNTERTSLSYFFSSLTNYTSGKYPAEQKNILERLISLESNAEPKATLDILNKITKDSELSCKEGKITNLCRAKLTLAMHRYEDNAYSIELF